MTSCHWPPKSTTLIAGLTLALLAACAQQPVAPTASPSPAPSVSDPAQAGGKPGDRAESYLKARSRGDLSQSEVRYRLGAVTLAPDAQRLVYSLGGTRQLHFSDGQDVWQPIRELWALERASGRKIRLEAQEGLPETGFDWLDATHLLTVARPLEGKNLPRLLRHDLASGKVSVIHEDAGLLQGDYSSDGWYYYLSRSGRLDAIQPASGARRGWDLTTSLSGKVQSVEALPGGRQLLLFDDRSGDDTPAPQSGFPAPRASTVPSTRVLVFDPAKGQAEELQALPAGAYRGGVLLAASDGSQLADATYTTSTQILALTSPDTSLKREARAVAWLDARQLLLAHSNRLEVYDVPTQRPVGQLLLAADEDLLGYDPFSRQALLQRGASRLLSVDLRSPSAPGQPQPLAAVGEDVALRADFGNDVVPGAQRVIRQDLQDTGGPLRISTLKPGGGLEPLLEIPYSPGHAFDPAALGTEPWYFGTGGMPHSPLF